MEHYADNHFKQWGFADSNSEMRRSWPVASISGVFLLYLFLPSLSHVTCYNYIDYQQIIAFWVFDGIATRYKINESE